MKTYTENMPLGDRRVVSCDKCGIVQFWPKSERCVRCGVSFILEDPISSETTPIEMTAQIVNDAPFVSDVSTAVRILRTIFSLSQRELAERMNVPRTYVSKVENGSCEPGMESVGKIARALAITERQFVLAVMGIDEARRAGTLRPGAQIQEVALSQLADKES